MIRPSLQRFARVAASRPTVHQQLVTLSAQYPRWFSGAATARKADSRHSDHHHECGHQHSNHDRIAEKSRSGHRAADGFVASTGADSAQQTAAPAVHQHSHHSQQHTNSSAFKPIAHPDGSVGFYQRELPADLIAFDSTEGKAIFRRGLHAGSIESYFTLAGQLLTQNEPAYCGPATLAMVLNALKVDPGRLWKGNWRWFAEDMLTTCDVRRPAGQPLHTVDEHGLSFEEMLLLSECNGARVEAFRANHSSEAMFRSAVIASARHSDLVLVASFSRKALKQTGDGHYSCIAGYDAQTDRCLVLDIARFKYPSYWCKVSDLWKAMEAIDVKTGLPRGYFLMSKAQQSANTQQTQPQLQQQVAALTHNDSVSTDSAYTPFDSNCSIAVDKASASSLSAYFCFILPNKLSALTKTASTPVTPAIVFGELLRTLPVELSTIFTKYSFDLAGRYSNSCTVCPSTLEETAAPASTSSRAQVERFQTYAAALPSPYASPAHSTHAHNQHQHGHHHHHHQHHRSSITSLLPLIDQIRVSDLYKCLDASLELIITHDAVIDRLRVEQDEAISSSSAHSLPIRVPIRYSLVGGLAKHSPDDQRSIELELTALLIFACPNQVFGSLPVALQQQVAQLRDIRQLPDDLQREVKNLRSTLGILADYCMCSANAGLPELQSATAAS